MIDKKFHILSEFLQFTFGLKQANTIQLWIKVVQDGHSVNCAKSFPNVLWAAMSLTCSWRNLPDVIVAVCLQNQVLNNSLVYFLSHTCASIMEVKIR